MTSVIVPFLLRGNEMVEVFKNLAVGLSDEKKKEIAELVLSGYKEDLESRSEWEERQVRWSALFALQRDKKNEPWEHCSNVGLPMLTMACIQFQARAYEALIPAKNISKSFPIGAGVEDRAKADRTEKYRNYLLDFKIKEFKPSFDTTLLKLPITGCVIRKTWYDVIKKRIVSDFLPATDFVVHYSTRYLRDAKRYTQRLYKNDIDVNELQKNGTYLSVELPVQNDVALDEVKIQHLKNVGLTPTSSSDNMSQRLILEQYAYFNLGGENEIKKPYIATVDYATGELLRLVDREHPKFPGTIMEHFTKYDFIKNPEGFYGLGFGLILEGANESVNTLINQLIDAGTLQNLQLGFTMAGSGMTKGEQRVKMGVFKEVKIKGDDIKKAVMPFNFGPPSQVLFMLLGTLQEYANRVTTVTESQTGDLPSSDTSATAVAAAIEQGTKVFSAIHKRTHASLADELYIMDRLLSLYLDPEEYYQIVINPEAEKQAGANPVDTLSVIVKDFDTPLDVRPVSDANIISRQEKAAKAQFVYQTILTNPLTAQDPQSIYGATVNLMKTVEIDDDVINQLVKQPPPPPEPVQLSQEEEIQKMINEQDVQANPQDNHQQHAAIIQEFQGSQFPEIISPNANQLIEKHKQQHISFIYLQKAQEQRLDEQVAIQEAQQQGQL